MNRLLYHGLLLAERSRVDSLSSGFRGRRARLEPQDIVAGLLIVAGIALVVLILSLFLGLQEKRRGRASPLRLFLSLCKAHRLAWSDWWLLWRVARAQQLRDPARLFLEPERLEVAHLNRSLRTRQARLSEIRDRLFDQLQEGQKLPDSPTPQMSDRPPGGVTTSG